jgi:thymidylate synthase
MFRNFSGQTADEAWLALAEAFRPTLIGERAEPSMQASRAGRTREILHATISIADPVHRWVASRNPPLNPAFAVAEVIWILSGRNDSALPNYFNRELAKFAGKGLTYHGAYGHRLRKHLGIDQLDRAYRTLLRQPESRQVAMQIWDARCDLPLEDGCPVAEDIPCNMMSLLKIRSGALEWTQILRSNDVFRGVPYNFIQFTTLQEIVAGWLRVKLGNYNQLSDSLHVYDRDAGLVSASIAAAGEPNTDSLALSRTDFDMALPEIAEKADAVTRDDVSTGTLIQLVATSSLPTAYRNLLRLLCAEGARRRRDLDAVAEIMSGCGNLCFSRLFDRWLARWTEIHKTDSDLTDVGAHPLH